jgi:hypothetical protein
LANQIHGASRVALGFARMHLAFIITCAPDPIFRGRAGRAAI